MLFLKTRGSVLGLAVALLWPVTASAQAPKASPGAATPPVRLKVDFVTVSAADLSADLNRLGLTLDRVPFAPPDGKPSQAGQFLRYITGDAAVGLLRVLSRTRSKSFQVPLVTTNSGVSATFQVNTQTPNQQKGPQTLQTGLTITPRINSDDSITLSVSSQAVDADTPPTAAQETTLRTIRSGDMMMVDGLPLGGGKTTPSERILVFIQPTLASPVSGRPNAAKRVLLEVSGAGLQTVVAMISQQTGVKVSVLGTAGSYKPVSVRSAAVPLVEALQALAASAGARVSRNAEGVYVFSPLAGR